ncbi:hypothetical protein MG293_009959 [Ovis ammon polii]|uniref:Triple QxxK/R motif-containing protein n=1 Tax=Ovis ammon polii TaxID=230172 RepID=A0AAD4U7R5_OVIAM|nr:hypothetical protein MG293_009959 [Ovis ammon polii]KAI4565974.1 hypothetical protein MJT46_009349 [Ovis ammon polii x Ovis aries]
MKEDSDFTPPQKPPDTLKLDVQLIHHGGQDRSQLVILNPGNGPRLIKFRSGVASINCQLFLEPNPSTRHQASCRSKMGRKDASTIKLPVDQYRKQIGKQDYKKTKPILRATKLKAEAKKTAIGIKEVGLVLAAILALLLAFYAFFYLRLSTDVDPDLEPDED